MLLISFCLQVLLTPTHLAIVMEYAAGGELFERICSAGRFSEDEVVNLQFVHICLTHWVNLSFSLMHMEVIYLKFPTDCLMLTLMAGEIFLPTANLWSQLLSCHGIVYEFFFF